MFDLPSYLNHARKQVDGMLMQCLDTSKTSARISRAMTYSVMAGGKRLRPVLCLAAAEAVGGDRAAVLPVACALELIHTYSLIHDDLPAMDDDELRRGNPTCHIRFDEATAILAGDALLTLAFEILASEGIRQADHDRQKWLKVIAFVAKASGYNGMIEGQMQDMASEGKKISRKELETLHRLKTGKMIEVSVASGAVVSGAANGHMKALAQYAKNIGLAFQVADDILNVKGNPKQMGKAVGTDQIRGKNTYPSLMGISGAEKMAAELVNNALKTLEIFDTKAEPLRAIARYVVERNR